METGVVRDGVDEQVLKREETAVRLLRQRSHCPDRTVQRRVMHCRVHAALGPEPPGARSH
eukprot:3005624-Rhodomonas_salina.1